MGFAVHILLADPYSEFSPDVACFAAVALLQLERPRNACRLLPPPCRHTQTRRASNDVTQNMFKVVNVSGWLRFAAAQRHRKVYVQVQLVDETRYI